MTREYDMTLRSQRAAETRRRILDATRSLLESRPIGEVTLPRIAAGAGVAVKTVLRHYGSRDGCLQAAADRLADEVRAGREASEPGDVPGAIANLVDHYERDGALVLALLAQERSGEAFPSEAAARGRAYHRAWVERCFGPLLPPSGSGTPSQARRDRMVDALVAATDLYVWKLLRHDLGRSRDATEDTVELTVRSLLEAR